MKFMRQQHARKEGVPLHAPRSGLTPVGRGAPPALRGAPPALRGAGARLRAAALGAAAEHSGLHPALLGIRVRGAAAAPPARAWLLLAGVEAAGAVLHLDAAVEIVLIAAPWAEVPWL